MVTKKQLQAEISELKAEVKRLKDFQEEKVFKFLKGINEKLTKHIKEENEGNEELDRIAEWLKDERIDDVQMFINKGDK